MKKSLAFLLSFCSLALLPVNGANADPVAAPAAEFHVSTLAEELARPPVAPTKGKNDAAIAQFTARILERHHFAQEPLSDEKSSQFLDRYLDTLDNLHMHFLQPDLAEFEPLRHALDDLTFNGKVDPAYLIFGRFLERLQQRASYVSELLAEESFDFALDERYDTDRENAPWPNDLEEARQLWRKHLKYELLQERLNADKPEEVEQKIRNRYARLLHTLKNYDSDNVLELYISALTRVYDPHSDYMGAHQLENFEIGMKLALFGIGALLQSEDGYCKIRSLVPGGPAERSKQLHEDDRIIAVAQGDEGEPVDVVDMNLMKIVQMIRGPKDTIVRLTVIPASAEDPSVRKTVRLVRDEIKLEDQEAKATLLEIPREDSPSPWRLGVIDLPSFYRDFNLGQDKVKGTPKSTTVDVAHLIRKLKEVEVDGVILDLRRNGGGSLEEAISLTGLFIEEGPVVQVKDLAGRRFVDRDEDPAVLYKGPLLVLTSRFSASASEILAGALQDYGRALVVGDVSTHGKGTVQSLIELEPYLREPSGALKITIRKFYRATGSSTQLRGVEPDIILPSMNELAEAGEASLENPLEWDQVEAEEFDKLNWIEPILAELKARSEKRIETDADFAYLIKEIGRAKEAKNRKWVSLNEEERLRERAEAKARLEKRKEELRNRQPENEVVYEISVKAAKEQGLPEPLDPDEQKENELSSTPHNGSPVVASDDEDEEPTPVVDVTLNEVKRILIDLIELQGRGDGALTVKAGASQ